MRTPSRWLVLGLVISGWAGTAQAGISASFQTISSAQGANDMSPDGRWIVGPSTFGPAYRYDTHTSQFLALPNTGFNAVAVSDDGQTIVGEMGTAGVLEAAIWKASTNTWQSIGFLPGASEGCGTNISSGYELSADGTVVVGLSWVATCQARGFRWTQATGMVELPLIGSNSSNRASACSANGNVIGGFARGPVTDRSPAIWTWNGSSAVGQFLDPAATAMGEIQGINEAGTVLLGNWDNKASKWTYPGLVRTQIGDGSIIPGWTGIPLDIANDGTIVGFDILFGNRRAWIQLAGAGPLLELKAYIVANGANVPPDVNMEVPQAISNDGRTIIGHGFGGAWIIKLTPVSTCNGDIAPPGGNNIVNVQDLLAVIAVWGEIGEDMPADLNDDFMVNVQDLLAVIGLWGNCPVGTGACCTGNSCSQLTSAACGTAGGIFLGLGVPCTAIACLDNDHCVDAINITASINGAGVLGDNGPATPAQFGGTDTELPNGSPTCHWAGEPQFAHSTVWYSFVAPANQSVTIRTCSSNPPFADSTLALFSGSCGSLAQIGCDEDSCNIPSEFPFYSRLIKTGLTPGVTYRICVMNPGGHNGSIPGPFTLTLTSP